MSRLKLALIGLGRMGRVHPNATGEVEVIEPRQFHVRTREYEIFSSKGYLNWLKQKPIKPIGMRVIRDAMRSAA